MFVGFIFDGFGGSVYFIRYVQVLHSNIISSMSAMLDEAELHRMLILSAVCLFIVSEPSYQY